MSVSVWNDGSVMSFWLSALSRGISFEAMDAVVPARSRPCFSPVPASSCVDAPWGTLAGAPRLTFEPLLMRRIFLVFSFSGVVSREWSREFMFRGIWSVCGVWVCQIGGDNGETYCWHKYLFSISISFGLCGLWRPWASFTWEWY